MILKISIPLLSIIIITNTPISTITMISQSLVIVRTGSTEYNYYNRGLLLMDSTKASHAYTKNENITFFLIMFLM